MMGIIKQNDIRGIFPGELSPQIVYPIGYYLPEILDARRIVVGRDSRTSSDRIFEALAEGITDAGADVTDIGLCDTPALYFATAFYNYSGSVMITASHNPPEYNGLKISRAGAVPVGFLSGLAALEELVKKDPDPPGTRGDVSVLDIRKDYVEHVLKFAAGDFRGMKIVIDCGNGAARAFARDIFSRLDAECRFLHEEPDGRFPNHGPNPLEEKSRRRIREEVLRWKADLGILFDGDADRAVFIDGTGSFVSPDLITSLIGHRYYGRDRTDGGMFYDIRSSRSVAEYIQSLGGRADPCPSGHANIKKILRDTGGCFAGELSGHYYFRENYCCDSGFIAALVVLSILRDLNSPLSELRTAVNPYAFSGEICFSVGDQEKILQALPPLFPRGRVTDLDGVRIDFDDWWFILRPSGAEPLLRLVVETAGQKELEEKVACLKAVILSLDEEGS